MSSLCSFWNCIRIECISGAFYWRGKIGALTEIRRFDGGGGGVGNGCGDAGAEWWVTYGIVADFPIK